MSVVYECEQETPHRRVAVKLMDSRLSGPAMNRRLRMEAEILGRLRHECIATIHEAGVTPKGEGSRPYFAMELVEGLPLTEFAEHGSLDTRARLQLLARVADGVEHAHQKGVIHRDLKPGNILVTPAGVPKILDFGIARVTDSDINTTTMHTSAGAILGTLAYMSPEQASADPAAVDTRSDVYSLGVLAFELLSGKLPHAVDDTPIHEAIRIIREDQPTLIATLDTSLRGDVDTIIAKALEQDADRRYASAAALADDIRRYLIDQPIMARPPSTLYRLQKFVRRNHALVGGGVATLTVLILGVVVSSLLALSERDARLAAQQQERLAQEREVVAISSVLSGASALRDANRPWEARRQLSGIDPDSRGWEWRHIALDLPWVIDIGNIRRIRDQAVATRFVTFSGDSSLVFESFRPESTVWTVDLRTE
ncbi:MAG: serine/threonine-protein kinase, partial [Planctomycetota bacterium]